MIAVTKSIRVGLNVYKGAVTLVQGYESAAGEFKPEMCMKRNYDSRAYTDKRALSIYLGKGDEARKNAALLASELMKFANDESGASGEPHGQPDMPFIPDDDVPF